MAQNSEIEKLERRWADNPLGLTFAPLAEAYRRAGDHSMALEVLTAGLATHAAYVPALIVQARCHLDAGLDGEAESSFRSVLASDAHNLIALKGLADICERTDRLQETRQYLDRLLEADPTHEEGRAQLARVTDLWEARAAVAPVQPTFAAPVLTEPTPTEPGVPEFDPAAIEIDAGWARQDPAPSTKPPAAEIIDAAESAAAELESATFEVADGDPAEVAGSPGDGAGSGGSDLLIEREVSPFEGFDPAGWDLPFADAPVPDQPFDESMPLGSISLEQGYVSNPAEATPLEGVVRHTDEGTATDPATLADSLPGLMQSDGDAVDPADAPGDAETAPPIAAEAGDAGRVPPISGWLPDAVAREVADEAMPSLHPMDIPDFAEWDEPAPLDLSAPTLPDATQGDEVLETPTPDSERWDSGAPMDAAMAADAESPPPIAAEGGEDPGDWEDSGEGAGQPGIPLPAPELEQRLWPEDLSSAELDEVAPFAPLGSDEPAEEAVFVVEGAAEEFPVESAAPESEVEPELVITETMAEVFLRQGHKPLALAVYAQLLERDPANSRLVAAVSRLRAELLPPGPGDSPAAEEPVGALLARVLDPESARPESPAAAATEAPPGGHPTQAAGDSSLSLSAIFGEEAPRVQTPAPVADSTAPSFDEFFGATGGPHGVATGAAGEEADLEQFNAWLRGLQR